MTTMSSSCDPLSLGEIVSDSTVTDNCDIDLQNHCVFCLHLLQEDKSGSKDPLQADHDTHHYASNPKITSFQHIWPYLQGSCGEETYRFLKGGGLPGETTFSSLVPPMCTQCYARILILNDLHVEMMKTKSKLLSQASELRDLILEAGDVTGENYRGRLKEFFEKSLNSGMMLTPMLKTMDFLCKLRGSKLIQFETKNLEDQSLNDWEAASMLDEDFAEDEDVKPTIDELKFDLDEPTAKIKETNNQSGTRKSTRERRRRKRWSSEESDPDFDYAPHENVSPSDNETGSDSEAHYQRAKAKRKHKKSPSKILNKQRSGLIPYKISPNKRSQVCEVCNKRIRVTEMVNHLKSHIKDYIYECPNPECGLAYISPIRRDRVHLKYSPECLAKANLTVEQVSMFVCNLCEFETTSPISYKAHLKDHEEHHDQKIFSCPFSSCSEAFGTKQMVEWHLTLHVYKNNPKLKKKQKCSICPKFFDLPDLEQHLRKDHNVSEVFKCRQCPAMFHTWSYLMQHKIVHRKRGEGLLCDLCPVVQGKEPENFESHAAMVEHYSKVHKKQVFSCPQCNKQYSTKYRVQYHLKDGKCPGIAQEEKAKEYESFEVTAIENCEVKMEESMGDQVEAEEFVEKEKSDKKTGHDATKSGFRCPQCHKQYSTKYRVQYHLKDGKCLGFPQVEQTRADKQAKERASEGCSGNDEVTNSDSSLPKWKFGLEKSQICEICNKRKRRSEMLEHLKTHVKEYVSECPNPSCGLVYASVIRRDRLHLRSSPECLKACNLKEEDVLMLNCDLCDFKTENKVAFQNHLNLHEAEAPSKIYSCPIENCMETFGVKQNVSLHLVSHNYFKNKQRECADDNAKDWSNLLDPHLKQGESSEQGDDDRRWILGLEKSQMCEVCNKRKRRCDMVAHLSTHVKDYIYICPNPSCALCYISPLRRLKHLKESPACLAVSKLSYKDVMTKECEICKYVTMHIHAFKMHVKRHEDEETVKSLKCPIESCSESFGVKHSLELHLSSHVFRNIPSLKMKQKCNICKKAILLTLYEKHLKKVHKTGEIFKCGQCPFMFENTKRLLFHKKVHFRRGEDVICDLSHENNLPVSFDKYMDYIKHCKTFHGIEKDITCSVCQKTFPTSDQLKAHKETENDCPGESQAQVEQASPAKKSFRKVKPKVFKCEVCQPPLEFNSEERFLTHNVREHGAEPYVCRICKKPFNSRATRNRHVNEEHDPNSKKNKLGYCCEYCGQRYSRASTLSAHRRSHLENSHYFCETCGKKFTQRTKLRLHIERIHFGFKRYQCPTCGMRLTSSSGLKLHLRVHTGERPYQCKECGKGFSQRGSLSSHLKTHYKNGMPPLEEKMESN